MKEQLISFETAKLAKEKGYKIEPDIWGEYALYKSDGLKAKGNKSFYLLKFEEEDGEVFPLTTQELLKKWLREVYNIIVTSYPITGFDKIEYSYNIYTFSNILSLTETTARRFNTDEKSLEEVLQKGLKLILKIDKNDNSKR